MTHESTKSTAVHIAMLAAIGTTLISSAALAQGQQGQPGGSGAGQQQQMQQQQMQQQQKRQADRAMNQQQTADHDRLQTRERDRTQTQVAQGSAKAADKGIYGGNLMTVEERNQYREQLGKLQQDEERNKFEARHREQMQLRAKERGIEPEVTTD